MDERIQAALQISIHTPVKGVTELVGRERARGFISIHTPVKGVTCLRSRSTSTGWYFNPHTREGCDGSDSGLAEVLKISIHTPVKGVTTKETRPCSQAEEFQSTHP